MPACRRRHHAWGMCAPCLAEFKAKHPKCNPQAQKRKSGRPALKYTGADAEFTDSSDDEGSRATGKSTGARARKVGSAKKGVEEKEAYE
ncbi:unnamed protein product, partial [Ectocarpus sp. 12 AP-2014]